MSGPPHKPVFLYRVKVGGTFIGQGEGGSKQIAQTLAAKDALSKLSK